MISLGSVVKLKIIFLAVRFFNVHTVPEKNFKKNKNHA